MESNITIHTPLVIKPNTLVCDGKLIERRMRYPLDKSREFSLSIFALWQMESGMWAIRYHLTVFAGSHVAEQPVEQPDEWNRLKSSLSGEFNKLVVNFHRNGHNLTLTLNNVRSVCFDEDVFACYTSTAYLRKRDVDMLEDLAARQGGTSEDQAG